MLAHRKFVTGAMFGPLPFLSTEPTAPQDALISALYHVLEHLDSARNYARILFVDLWTQCLPTPSCHRSWSTTFFCKFLSPPVDELWTCSKSITTNVAQDCILSPLFSMYNNSCVYSHTSIMLLKFADAIILGLFSRDDYLAKDDVCSVLHCHY